MPEGPHVEGGFHVSPQENNPSTKEYNTLLLSLKISIMEGGDLYNTNEKDNTYTPLHMY